MHYVFTYVNCIKLTPPVGAHRPTLQINQQLRTFAQYSVAFFRRQEEARDAIFGNFVKLIISDKIVKFGDHSLDRSRGIRPKAVVYGIFGVLLAISADRKQQATSYPVWLADHVGVDVRVKLGDSR